MDEEEGLEASRTADGNSSFDVLTGLWTVATPVTDNRKTTPKLLSEYTRPSVVKGISLKYVTDIAEGLPKEPLEVSFILSSRGPGDEKFTEVADPKTKEAVKNVTLQLDVPVMFLLPETAPLQDVTSIRVELVGVSSTNKTTLDVDILGCSKEVSTTLRGPVRDQIKTTLPTKVKVTTVNVVTSPVGITTEETTTVKTTSPPKATTEEVSETTLVSTVTKVTTGPSFTTEEVKTTTITTPAGERLTTTTSLPLVSTTPGYCLEPMDEEEGLEASRTADGNSSFDVLTGLWTVATPVTDNRKTTPKLLSEYTRPSVVKGISLKYVTDIAEGLPKEPLEVSFILSSRGPGDEKFTEVADPKTKEAVKNVTLQLDVPVMFLLPETAPLQDVTSIRVELVGVSSTNKTTLDVDILGCSKEVSTTLRGPVRDQMKTTLPTKVKVTTVNVVTSPVGITTEETTTVKTTSPPKATTEEVSETTLVSTVTKVTTGPSFTTEEVKTTTITTPAGERLTTTTSLPLVSTTPGYCLEPMDEEEGLEASRTADGNSSFDVLTGLWTVATPVTDNRKTTPKLLSEYTRPSVVKGISLKYVTDIAEGLPKEPLEVSFILSSRGPGDEKFTEVADPKTKEAVKNVTLQLDVPVMFLLPETAPLQDVTSIRVELVGVSSTNKTTLDVDILGCSKEVSTTSRGPVRDQMKTTLPSKVKVTTVNVVTSPVGITTEETTTVKTTSPPKATTEVSETTLVSTVTKVTTGPSFTTEEVKTTTITTPAGERLTTTTSLPLVSTTPGYCLEPMDEEEGLEASRTADGNSSFDVLTGLWTVATPVTDNRKTTPKLLSEYTRPSVVKGISLKYVTDIAEGLPKEPLEVSFILSSRGPGDEKFTEVADPKTKEAVKNVTLQLDVPVMFLLPETAPLQDVTSIRVELVGVSSTNKTTLDVDILGCSKEVSTTTRGPVRDQMKTTLPSKVKVTTVNVVTSPVGITTEETTTVKTTSPPKATTEELPRLGWALWSEWSSCTFTCGNGQMLRSRLCQNQLNQEECEGGVEKGTEIKPCNTDPCPVNGNWTSWTLWSECDRSCGGGTQYRSRRCSNPLPKNGGLPCGDTKEQLETLMCNTQPCNEPCGRGSIFDDCNLFKKPQSMPRSCLELSSQMSNMNSTECTPSCRCEEGRVFNNDLECIQPSECSCFMDGQLYLPGETVIKKKECQICECQHGRMECKDTPCDGDWSGWTVWSQCDKTCGWGTRLRFRSCTNPAPRNGGRDCPDDGSMESRSCSEMACKVDGQPGPWGRWSSCTATCGAGTQHRKRDCNNPMPQNGGEDCAREPMQETRPCALDKCLNGCGPGMELIPCGSTCQPLHCQQLSIQADCIDEECHSLCRCKDGRFLQNGRCVKPQECQCMVDMGGEVLQELMLMESVTINCKECLCMNGVLNCVEKHNCAVNGNFSDWSPWEPCDHTCGVGFHTRRRSCSNPPPRNGGKRCLGADQQRLPCSDLKPCPGALSSIAPSCVAFGNCSKDCTWNLWSDWSSCTRSCGLGLERRTRSYNPAEHGGRDCHNKNDTRETRPCSIKACPVNGGFSVWSPWTACSKSCEGGQTIRTRNCNTPTPKNNGAMCSGFSKETKTCNTQPCGSTCPAGKVYSIINGNPCPSHCAQLQRGTVCSDLEQRQPGCRCRNGHLEDEDGKCIPRERCECVDEEGKIWPANSQYDIKCNTCVCRGGQITCTERDCPVDCGFSAWSIWSSCQQTCGEAAVKTRFRSSNNPPASEGGEACHGVTREDTPCGLKPCPLFCSSDGKMYAEGEVMSDDGCNTCTCQLGHPSCTNHTCIADPNPQWSPWSSCDVTCGNEGRMVRSRACTSKDAKNDPSCVDGVKMDTKKCGLLPCPEDGNWCAWSPWSTCTTSCGVGETTRSRECMCNEAMNGGKDCQGKGEETKGCFTKACPVNCAWDKWSSWSECSKTCGTAEQISIRKRTRAENGGKECVGAGMRTKMCNLPPCSGSCPAPFVNRGCATTCPRSCVDLSKNSECLIPKRCEGGCTCPGDSLLQGSDCVKPSECRCTITKSDLKGIPASSYGSFIKPISISGLFEMSAGNVIESDCSKCECIVGRLECTNKRCKESGGWSEWSQWVGCSETCSDEPVSKQRFRSCSNPKPNTAMFTGSSGCHGEAVEERICEDVNPCPVDCEYGPWLEWSGCNAPCSGGSRLRKRDIITPAQYGGRQCEEKSLQSQPCNVEPCPGLSCAEMGMIQDEFATRCPLTCQDVSLQCIQPSCQTGCRCRDGEYLQDGHCIPREECNCMLDMADIVQRNQKYLKMLSMDAVGLMLRTTPQPPPPALYQATCNQPIPLPPTAPESLDFISWPYYSAIYGWHGDLLTLVFKEVNHITGVKVLGGGARSRDYLERFVLLYEEEETKILRPILSHDAITPMIFQGNTDAVSIVEIPLPYGGVKTRVLTLLPIISSGDDFKLRLQLLSCPNDGASQDAHQPSSIKRDKLIPSMSIQVESATPPSSIPSPQDSLKTFGTPTGTAPNGAFIPGSVIDFPCSQCNCTGGSFKCVDAACPYFDTWSPWTECTSSCNGGSQKRSRTCLGETGEKDCDGPVKEERRCNMDPCQVDCRWSTWSAWSTCGDTCDVGHQTRNRTLLLPALFGGRPCQGPHTERLFFNTQSCQTCLQGMTRSPCSKKCPRECRDIQGGFKCLLNEREKCQVGCRCPEGLLLQDGQCVAIKDCRCLLDLRSFGTLPPTIPKSITDRFNNHTLSYGRDLVPMQEFQSGDVIYRQCNKCTCEGGSFKCTNQICRKDCGWSEWSDWSECSVTCGSGVRRSRRTPNKPEKAYGGAECEGPIEKEEKCYAGNCKCKTNEIFSRTATSCRPTCQNMGTSEDIDTSYHHPSCGKPHEGCICKAGYYLNSKEDCILPHQCECKDEDGLLRRPNEQWRPDTCSVCNCRNGEVKCKKECKVTSCPENFELIMEPGKCCPVCRERYEPVNTCHLELVTRNISNSAGCRVNNIQINVCIGSCTQPKEILLHHPEFSVCQCCQGVFKKVTGMREVEDRDFGMIDLVCEDGSIVQAPIAKYSGCACQQPCDKPFINNVLP
ncbi:uncharacterized protein LOC117300041 isoform X3 [Asterias rubens]|uniref:uncharacterized protein LOC117300041 isoform X3 n=1 Tax=Asterias rubens TaxID=7604 RepID=UPI0014555E4B|nr:uncharacterized protein LOC117300041 isoform X3 [Asterias rubens]